MPSFDFPQGQYLAVTSRLALGKGGQTAMFLLRSRLFAEKAGISPTLASFDDQPDYPAIRAALIGEGRVPASTVIVNLYEWLRNEPPPLAKDGAETLPVLERLENAVEEPHPDGSIHRITYNDAQGEFLATDYLRRDGSVYARQTPDGHLLSDRLNRVARQFRTTGGLRRWWLSRLFDPDTKHPVFIISDSRFATRSLVPLTSRARVRLIHVVHNIHVVEPYEPDSPVHPTHEPVLEEIPRLSALVTLTERQRDDIAQRFETADNLHVIANPVDGFLVEGVEQPRRAGHFVMMGRLERQKRIDDAISAFAHVVAEEPDARLDIYGEGNQREVLEEQIREAGLENSVRLLGYDARAKEQLAGATALLLTSRFEGYPLVVLEALQRGCPVIAYDIPYGPREQVGEGGFLVPAGDTRTLAERMLRLVREPALVARMSKAALVQAEGHSPDGYLAAWQQVLRAVVSSQQGEERDKKQGEDQAEGEGAEAAQPVGEE